MTPSPITQRLAEFIHRSSIEHFPPPVRHEAKRSLVNWMAAALGGCGDESVHCALETLAEFAASGQATIIGHHARIDALTAALINGISSNILDFDDTHAHIVLHPTASIACALLALSESRRITGIEFIHALVLGIEVEARLLDPRVAEYKFAWSPTTTVAGMGAAAACARALGLDETRIAWALGIAGTQASGLRETGGTMSKAFNAGQAARAGLTSALLASRGFTGSRTVLEGPNGFINAFGNPRNLDMALEGWGQRYHISSNTYKAFPCGIVTHPVICSCLDLHAQGIGADAIEFLQLTVHPMAVKLTGRTRPTGPLDAKLSVTHTAAAALVRGKLGVKEFELSCIDDPRVTRLREKADVVVNDSFAMDEATVEVRMSDGRILKAHTDHAIGSLDRPMSDRALEEKLASMAEDVLTEAQIRTLLAQLWSLDQLDDASAIARAAARTS